MTTSLSQSPAVPKPGEAITLTCAGYSAGESRTIAILVDGGEVKRITTKSASVKTTIPGLPAGQHTVDANGMKGCAQVKFTVTAAAPGPTPTPSPSSGIPATPADHDLWLRDFSDGKLGELRLVTYMTPANHPGDGMLYATDYDGQAARLVFQKDGDRTYLRQRCIAKDATRKRFDGTFLSTGGGMGAPTFAMQRGYLELAFRCPGAGQGVGEWFTPGWFRDDNNSDGSKWSGRELDLFEGTEDGKGRFTLHGYGAEQKMIGLPLGDIGTNWHRVGAAFFNDHTSVTFDGKTIKSTSSVIDRPLNFLTDNKAGYPWQAGTPSGVPAEWDVDLAWIIATSKIPAGVL